MEILKKNFINREKYGILISILGSVCILTLTNRFYKQKRNNSKSREKSHKNFKLENINEISYIPSSRKIHISNLKKLAKKIRKLKVEGSDNLMIAADFDRTITSFNIDGRDNYAALRLFIESKHVTSTFKAKCHLIRYKYIPLENDPTLPFEEKQKIMKEWNFKNSEALFEEKIDSNLISEITKEHKIGIRYNFQSFFKSCKNLNLPFYVISQGAYQAIELILSIHVNFFDFENTLLFANKFNINNEGVITGIKSDIDTTRKQYVLKENNIPYRKNGILFGDVIGDSQICNSLGMETLIKIGFLHNPESLELYESHFDIVIEGEGDYIPAEAIIQYIAKGEIEKSFRYMLEKSGDFEFLAIFNEGF